jgi:hypothetical protein
MGQTNVLQLQAVFQKPTRHDSIKRQILSAEYVVSHTNLNKYLVSLLDPSNFSVRLCVQL